MISLFFLQLSRDFFTTFLSLIPSLLLFPVMCAIDAATIRWSEAQLRLRQPQTEMATPSTSTALSTSTPSSFVGGVTLEAIMAQLVCMDARLDTLSDELCQVNTRVGHITR